jgi:hypothetical protein
MKDDMLHEIAEDMYYKGYDEEMALEIADLFVYKSLTIAEAIEEVEKRRKQNYGK